MKRIVGVLLMGTIAVAATIPQNGLKAEMAGEWHKAIDIYKQALVKKPSRVNLYIRLADIYSKEKQYEKAAEALNQAVVIEPKRADLYARLASVYSVLNKPKQALEAWGKALKLQPNNVSYLISHAKVANWLGKPAIAAKDLRKAVRLDPANKSLVLALSQSLEWANQEYSAIPFYKKYLKSNPNNLKVWLILAQLQKQEDNVSEADTTLKEAYDRFAKRATPAIDKKLLHNLKIPILEYHCVEDIPSNTYSVATKEFKAQIEDLTKHGYHAVTMHTIGKVLMNQAALPKKPIAITFDDGCQNIYTKAFPILKDNGYAATAYIITDATNEKKNGGAVQLGENAENAPIEYMTWPEINKLIAAGWTIGSHTDSHPYMSTVDSQNQVYELLYSKLEILANTGKNIGSFAYPYGDGAAENALHKDLSSFGYITAVASTGGIANLETANVYTLPRVWIYGPKPQLDPQSKGVSVIKNPLRPEDSFMAQIKPDKAQRAYERANLYSVSKKPMLALASINEAVRLAPNNLVYLKTQAQIAGEADSASIAVDAAKKIYRLEPTDANLLALARAEVWANKLDDAYDHYALYLKKHNEDKAVWIEFVEVEMWVGKYADSMDTLHLYKQKFGETPEYWKTKAEVLSWGNRSRKALKILNKKLQKSPNDYDAHYTRAVAYNGNYQPIEAIEDLKKVEQIRPKAIKDNEFLRKYLTTQFRPSITAGFQYYSDSYDVSDRTLSLEGKYFFSPLTSISAMIKRDDLRATVASGYAQDDGTENATYQSASVGIAHRFSPFIALRASAGGATAEHNSDFIYSVGAFWTPLNILSFDLSQSRNYSLESPRTAGRGIMDSKTQLSIAWEPNMRTDVNLIGTFDALSDTNTRWGVELNPIWEVARLQYWNFDIGPDIIFHGYAKQYTDHGYYAPKLIQEYYLSGYINWKKSDNDGVNLVLSAGAVHDSFAGEMKPSGSATLEGVFGMYRDWMFKASASIDYTPRFYDQSYTGTSVSLFVTRRF